MVVFTCNHCGESLHKPKVEKHYNFVCKTVKSLTCVDCFKDFRDEEYVVHTKCLTEDERYAEKGSLPNGIVKKGEVKQESWLDMIKSILNQELNVKPSIQNLLETISTYSNVPRKKPKFINFVTSSSGNRINQSDIEEVWDIIQNYKNSLTAKTESMQKSNELNGQESANNVEGTKKKKSKKKKSHHESNVELTENDEKTNGTEDVNIKLNEESSKKKKKRGKVQDDTFKNHTETKTETTITEIKGSEGESNSIEMKDGNKPKAKKKKQSDETNTENGETKLKRKKPSNDAKNEPSSPKKGKLDDTQETPANGHSTEITFDYAAQILTVLSSAESVPIKKLEKKVKKAYLKFTEKSEDPQKFAKKFNRKLKKMANVEIIDDNVILKK